MTEKDERDEVLTWERLDARRRNPVTGRGPDIDDEPTGRAAPRGANELDDHGHLASVEGDLWKRSEYLKCKLGWPMWSDDRGLPTNYQDKRPLSQRGPRRRR